MSESINPENFREVLAKAIREREELSLRIESMKKAITNFEKTIDRLNVVNGRLQDTLTITQIQIKELNVMFSAQRRSRNRRLTN